jgi:hypothetical protein
MVWQLFFSCSSSFALKIFYGCSSSLVVLLIKYLGLYLMKKIKLVVFSRLKKYQKLNSYHPHLCGGRCCCDVFIVGIVEE